MLQSNVDLPYNAIKSNFADSVNLLLHIERRDSLRYVSELIEVRSYDAEADKYELETLYNRTDVPEFNSESASRTATIISTSIVAEQGKTITQSEWCKESSYICHSFRLLPIIIFIQRTTTHQDSQGWTHSSSDLGEPL